MDPYLRKKDWLRGPGRSGRVPCEARNRYGAVAFTPFALCGCGHRAFGLVRVGSRRKRWRRLASSGRSGEGEGASRVPSLFFSLPVVMLSRCRLFALPCGPLCRRYHSVATGASVGEQNGSSPGSSWSATASSPSSGCVRLVRIRSDLLLVARCSAPLSDVGVFVRQRTVDSELVRTGGIRLSN